MFLASVDAIIGVFLTKEAAISTGLTFGVEVCVCGGGGGGRGGSP